MDSRGTSGVSAGASSPVQPPGRGILKKTKKQVTEAKTPSGRSVSAISADEVSASFPAPSRKATKPKGVHLHQRTITVKLGVTGIFTFIKNLLINRSTRAQEEVLKKVFNNLGQALGKDSSRLLVNDTNSFTATTGSVDHKIGALMVAAGLARMDSEAAESGIVKIQTIQPQNFCLQVHAMEVIVQLCDLDVDATGYLNWEKILEDGDSARALREAGVIGKDDKPVPDWYTSRQIAPMLEQVLKGRKKLKRQLQQLSSLRPGGNQWDLARTRIKELKEIAESRGMEDIVTALPRNTKNISRISQSDWENEVKKLRDISPLFAEKLEEVTPVYSQNFVASDRKEQEIQYHTPPSTEKLEAYLDQLKLNNTIVTLETVRKAETDSSEQGQLASFPLVPAFREAVRKEMSSQLRKQFELLKLSKSNPVSLQRLQQGLGRLKRHHPEYYRLCLDDSDRAKLIQNIEARIEAEKSIGKELRDYSKENSLDDFMKDVNTKLLGAKPANKGVPLHAPIMPLNIALELIKSYDAMVAVISMSHSDMTLDDMVNLTAERAMQEGIVLDTLAWGKGCTKVPLPRESDQE